MLDVSIGALIIRVGFWGTLYYINNKEPPQKKASIKAPILDGLRV